MVREAQCDALVPVHRRVSTCDDELARTFPWSIYVWVVDVISLFHDFITASLFEPPHDKTNNVAVCPAKTQISLGIHPVWPESSLCVQCLAKDPSFLNADSEDSDQTGRMPRLILVFAGCTATLFGLSWGGSYVNFRTCDCSKISFCYDLKKCNRYINVSPITTEWDMAFYILILCYKHRDIFLWLENNAWNILVILRLNLKAEIRNHVSQWSN